MILEREKQLTESFVAFVDTVGRYGDGRGGNGLSLLVKYLKDGSLSKTFSQRLTVDGRARNIGLGAYPLVSLQEARIMAKENAKKVRRHRVRRGLDALLAGVAPVAPVAPTVKAVRAVLFRDAAEAVIKINRAGWKQGGQSEQQWRYSLVTYAFPRIGDKLVSAVTSADVMAILTPIWNEKRETAGRVKQRIGAVMDWAIAQGLRTDNPVTAVAAALPKNGVKVQHHAALPWNDVQAALSKVRESTARLSSRLAFEFLALTALRSGEVRGAPWEEFDLDGATLTIPAHRMKSGREHRVPLSKQAVACVLSAGTEVFDGRGYIFPGQNGKQLSDMALTMILRRLEIPATVHGMRSTFRDWAAENSDVPREIAEHALAHVEGSAAELAYRRTDYLDKRRELMQDWADFVCQA